MTVPPPQATPEAAIAHAVDALRARDLPGALAAYDVALVRLHVYGDPERRGAAFFGRGLVQQLLGNHAAALADIVSAFAAWRAGRPGWVAAALAEVAVAVEDFDELLAADYWQTADRLAGRGGDDRLRGVLRGHLGRIAAEDGSREEARRLWMDAERLARAAGDDDTAAAALINLAGIDLDSGSTNEASRRVGEALALAPHGPHEAAAARALADLAILEAIAGRTMVAERYLEQAFSLGDFQNADSRERVLLALAGLARDRKDLDEARRLGEQALDLVRRRGEVAALAFTLHDLAVIALEGGWIDDAERWWSQALHVARKRRLDPVITATLRGLADVSRLRGNDVAALRWSEEAASSAMNLEEQEACARTLAAVGEAAAERRHHDIGVAAYEGAIALYRSAGRERDASVYETALAALRAKQ